MGLSRRKKQKLVFHAKLLRDLRTELGISQAELSEQLNGVKSYHRSPLPTLRRLAKRLEKRDTEPFVFTIR